MQIIRYIILFTCIIQFGYSQSAGYMGKHIQIGYGFNTSPAFINSTANQQTIFGDYGSSQRGSFAFNIVHEAYLDYILSSKWTLGFSGRFYKTNFDNGMGYKSPFESPYYSSYNYSSDNDGSERPDGFYTIKGQSYTLCFKFFGNRYVAPWGRYVMFGPVLNTYKAEYDPIIMNDKLTFYNTNYSSYYSSNSSDTILRDFGATQQSYKKIGLMVGWGRSRVLANRITFDYGVTAQPLSIVSVFLRQSGFASLFFKKEISNANYIAESSKRRVQGINTVNVFLKIGFLLF
jgi:hypothetical protein